MGGNGKMLKARMRILRDGGIIAPEIADFMDGVIGLLEETFPNVPQDPAERFTTHMAMAAQRIRQGEPAAPLDVDSWEQVTACDEFDRGNAFLEQILTRSPVEFPESERQYLLLHICAMLAEC